VAQVLAERTRDTDLDKDQKIAEARKNAQRALVTVDTDVPSSGYPPEQLRRLRDSKVGGLRDSRHAGFQRQGIRGCGRKFEKSIDAFPQQVDPIAVFRLSVSSGYAEQNNPEALKVRQPGGGF